MSTRDADRLAARGDRPSRRPSSTCSSRSCKAAQARLKQLEKETARALAIQKAAYAKLLRNKKNLAKAIATTAEGASERSPPRSTSSSPRSSRSGNIPSKFNGSLSWPMAGYVSGEFGCTARTRVTGPATAAPTSTTGSTSSRGPAAGRRSRRPAAGRIGYIGWNYADGADPAWIVIIVHSQNLQTWYAHMKAHTYPGGIRRGSLIKTGQLIGYEGTTGHATGCHLHWMVEYNGAS